MSKEHNTTLVKDIKLLITLELVSKNIKNSSLSSLSSNIAT